MATRRPLIYIAIFFVYLNLYLTLVQIHEFQNEKHGDVDEQTCDEAHNPYKKGTYSNETFQFLRALFGLGSSNLNDYYDQKNVSTEDEHSQNKTWTKNEDDNFKNIFSKSNYRKFSFERFMTIGQDEPLQDENNGQNTKDADKYMVNTTPHENSRVKPILWKLKSNDSILGLISNVILGVYIEPNLLLSYEVILKIDEFGVFTVHYDPEYEMSFLELLEMAKNSIKNN